VSLDNTGLAVCRRDARKGQQRMEMAMRLARFPQGRTLKAFDFDNQPSIDPAQIRDLATPARLANRDDLLLLGPPGMSKTHLAVALGREAVRLGYSVQSIGAMELMRVLAKAQVQQTLKARLTEGQKRMSLESPRLAIHL
jgi:DNA replication protein DnaC